MADPAKGQPFSIRFSKSTDLYVDAEARRTGRSKSAVVEDLALEAAKARRFPGISFQGEWPDREPVITDTKFSWANQASNPHATPSATPGTARFTSLVTSSPIAGTISSGAR